MKIDKALKKEKKHKNIFFTFMIFLAVFLPVVTYLSYVKSTFIIIYLAILEILILLATINKINHYKLKFVCSNNRLRFKSGIIGKDSLILCNKVVIVHTSKKDEDIDIIIVTTMNFKNKRLKPVNKMLLHKYPEIEKEISRLKKINPNVIYYFQVIRRGALKKYVLLDNVYRNCVNSVYTNEAIENIKIARGQNEI